MAVHATSSDATAIGSWSISPDENLKAATNGASSDAPAPAASSSSSPPSDPSSAEAKRVAAARARARARARTRANGALAGRDVDVLTLREWKLNLDCVINNLQTAAEINHNRPDGSTQTDRLRPGTISTSAPRGRSGHSRSSLSHSQEGVGDTMEEAEAEYEREKSELDHVLAEHKGTTSQLEEVKDHLEGKLILKW